MKLVPMKLIAPGLSVPLGTCAGHPTIVLALRAPDAQTTIFYRWSVN